MDRLKTMARLALCLAVSLTIQANAGAQDDALRSRAEQVLKSMSIEQKVYQMFVVRPESLTNVKAATAAGERTREALAKYPVGGVVYFSANLQNRKQVTKMIANTQAAAEDAGAPGLFIAVDEEGGRVARCAGNLGTTKFPPMVKIGATGDPERAYAAYSTIGSDIAQFGFNLDMAPVADVITNPKNVAIGNRAFGTDAALVADMVARAVEGLHDQGVMAVLKHFPGGGDTKSDPHHGTDITDRTLDQMRAVELVPFKAGIEAGADMVMVSHVTATSLDPSAPSCLSPVIVTDLLRTELGFDGVVITDALEMKAVSGHYTGEEIALGAVNAGVDILLMPSHFGAMSQALIDAVHSGEVSEQRIDESVLRILTLKQKYGLLD